MWNTQRIVKRARSISRFKVNFGKCPVCSAGKPKQVRTAFVEIGPWLRDNYVCSRCLSIPRERALMVVLEDVCPAWRELRMHESSPLHRGLSGRLEAQCGNYESSQFFPGVKSGVIVDGLRCEDLEAMSLETASLDVLITQDVMEHILNPAVALWEMARVLRPGGMHVCTFPWYPWIGQTRTRARREEDGSVLHLLPEQYHASPVSGGRALVTTDWGTDLADRVEEAGMSCEVHHVSQDRHRGLDGEFLNVFVFRKPVKEGYSPFDVMTRS
jgi:SAM-dependent methyltransferase